MIQGVAIDLILLRVNGGELSDEGAVQRSDIRAFLPIAINYATQKAYYINRREEGDRDFPSNFYGTFSGLAINKTTTPPTITLPKAIVSLPSNQGIRYVMDDCGNTYTPLNDADMTMINYYGNIFSEERFYRRTGLVIQLYNMPKLALTSNVVAMADPTTFTDDTELPIQAGMETDVIEMTVAHFREQRGTPADVIVDDKDVNTK